MRSSAARPKRAPRVLMIVDTEPFASRSLVRALICRFDDVLYAPGVETAEKLLGCTPITHILVCDVAGSDPTRALAERVPRWRLEHRAVARVILLPRVALVRTLTPAAIDYVMDQDADLEEVLAVLAN